MPQTFRQPFMAGTMVEAGHHVKVPVFGTLPIRAAQDALPNLFGSAHLRKD